jgi:hypothetical protein
VSSIELLQSNPAAVLTKVVRRDQRPNTLGIDAPDGDVKNKKEMLKKLSHSRPSSKFIDCGYHYVMHDFPWKREELMEDLMEMTDGEGLDEVNNLISPMSRRSRIVSSRRSRIPSDGSEDVFEPEPLPELMIDMEEDRNEEQRRIQANYKWNLRRQKIEHEFLRLRHLSINKSRAAGGLTRLRHSVSFGDDLEIQLEQSGMRELEKSLEGEDKGVSENVPSMNGNKPVGAWSVPKRPVNPNKPYGRTMSMPSKDFDDIHSHSTFPRTKGMTLEMRDDFIEEEEEEEDEDEGEAGMLGLPPKDIPNLSVEQLDWTEETDNDEID